MSRLAVFVLSVLHVALVASSEPIYSIAAPGTLRVNTPYHVAVSIHQADEPCQIKVGLIGPDFSDSQTITVPPASTETVKFNVPSNLKQGNYNITAEGVSGIQFKNTTKLELSESYFSTYIQTDKATYKPGDLVQFRVIFLDAHTRPAQLKGPVDIIINDGAQNRIKQFSDVAVKNGLVSEKLQLSEQPVLGNWEIKVSVNGVHAQDKTIEVAKYVLPKFEVTVEAPADIAFSDNLLRATIRAKYTYGKPLKGKAIVTVTQLYQPWSTEERIEVIKTIPLDGKAHAEFNLNKDLKLATNLTYFPAMKVFAVVEEELTGLKQNGTASVNIHKNKYKVEALPDNPTSYVHDQPIVVQFVVKNVDGSPVGDTVNEVVLTVETPRFGFYGTTTETPRPEDLVLKANLDKDSIATFQFTPPSCNCSYYSFNAKYRDFSGYVGSISEMGPRTGEYFALEPLSKKPTLDKDLTIKATSNLPLGDLYVQIVARGNIVSSKKYETPKDAKEFEFSFKPTYDMVPSATVYASFLHEGNFYFEETYVSFEAEFENSIDISVPAKAKPGQNVTLNVETKPESTVGLLGVDQSVLLLKGGNDLNKESIVNDLRRFGSTTPWVGYGRYPGGVSGLVTMTNAHYPYQEILPMLEYAFLERDGVVATFDMIDIRTEEQYDKVDSPPSSSGASVEPVVIRKEFPETWIWMDFKKSENSITLQKQVPDTITSWVITGFSLNEKHGFAMTDKPSKLQVFQPFFVSTNLPYSVKRGEVIAIPVIIFNYMDKNLDAEVTMDNMDKEFEFTEATNEIDENPIDEVKRSKTVSIASNSGRTVSFMIRPKKVGQITLKIVATTPLAGDAIHQILRVEPEGVTQFVNKAVFINLNDKSEQTEVTKIDIPADVVPDSEYIEFSVVGDLLGPTIQNLDKLVRMPYGCGEQNMVNFVPNILVLKYLTTVGQLTPAIEEKAKKFLEVGYQRELTYKHPDGSYSAFGKSDPSGSTWLTAYVARSFHQAANYTEIDPKVLEEALDFLVKTQAKNGSFPETGRIIDHHHSNGEDMGLSLTAFVLLAFLENKESIPKYQETINNGLKYLDENLDTVDNLYALAISSYALQLAQHPKAEKAAAKLQTLANKEGDRKWWSKTEDKTEKKDVYFWFPTSVDVEITSYSLLSLLEKQSAEDALPVIKWLISQRNSNGGFASTQDTVVGLQALIKFSEKAGSGSGEIDVAFKDDVNTVDTIKVNNKNSLIQQTHVLPKKAREVTINAKGKGSCIAQVSYRYNTASKDAQPSFSIKPVVKSSSNSLLSLEVCTSYKSKDGVESNMAVMEISLPSGFTADSDSFDKLEQVDRVKKIETKNDDSVIVVYFDSLGKDESCGVIEAIRTHAVAKQKPTAVVVYDYYDNGQRATEYYSIESSLCDICQGDDCGQGCAKAKN